MHVVASLTFSAAALAQTTASGKVEPFRIHSPRYSFDRHGAVYTPPGYSPTLANGYPLLVVFDAAPHLDPNGRPVPRVLDSLVALGRIPAMVAVFLDDSLGGVRTSELGNNARFAEFMGEELVPWVRQHWNVTHDPHRTIVAGSSAGGLGAAFVALQRPDLFGNVLSQSGAFWRGAEGSNAPPYEFLASQVSASPAKDVRFLLDVGSRETGKVLGGTGPVFIEATRRLHDALVARGYSVTYTEIPGGAHWPETWEPRFAPDLVTLAGPWLATGTSTTH